MKFYMFLLILYVFQFQTNCVHYAWKHFKVEKVLNQLLTK
jgi:hypothetical protein